MTGLKLVTAAIGSRIGWVAKVPALLSDGSRFEARSRQLGKAIVCGAHMYSAKPCLQEHE